MDNYYNIAGINIKITGDDLMTADDRTPLLPFISEPFENPDSIITLVSEPIEIHTTPNYNYSRWEANWAKLDDGKTNVTFLKPDAKIRANALISMDWKEIKIYVNVENIYSGYIWNPILFVFFYHLCLFHKSMAIHAAAIEYNGGAIAFSARSGTGKSTHAGFWVDNFGAEYINGDVPLLRFINDKLHVCGTAWSGKDRIFKNLRVPLDAIVFLEQHQENIIEKINSVQALKKIVQMCILPHYDRDMMSLAMDNIEAVITQTDCYLLKCTPDIRAAELVKKCITANKK